MVSFGVKIKKTNCTRRQPIHVKCLLSGMCKLLEDNFHRLIILRGKFKGVSNNIFLVRNLPPDFGVLSVDLESASHLGLVFRPLIGWRPPKSPSPASWDLAVKRSDSLSPAPLGEGRREREVGGSKKSMSPLCSVWCIVFSRASLERVSL